MKTNENKIKNTPRTCHLDPSGACYFLFKANNKAISWIDLLGDHRMPYKPRPSTYKKDPYIL